MFKNNIIRRNHLYFREFTTIDNRELVIIEPGYIINKTAYAVWDMIEADTSYDLLFAKVKKKFPGAEEKALESNLGTLLEGLLDRGLISVDGTDYKADKKRVDAKLESDIYKDYGTTVITQIDIVVTTGCNFRCRHCFIQDNNYNNTDRLELEEWKRVIDNLCKQGLISVIVTGGEPLVYKQIGELLDYIDSQNLKIQLLTNGYLLDESFISRISNYKNVVVQVSLDGSNEESNDFQRNKQDAFKRVTENIKQLKAHGIEVILSMVLNKKNLKDIYNQSMFRLSDELGVDVLGITPTVINIGHAVDHSEDYLEVEEITKVIDFIEDYKKNSASGCYINLSAPPALTEEKSVYKKERPRCRRGINSFSIRPNGDICVCSDFMEVNYKEYELGNILHEDFEGILKKLSKIRTDKLESVTKIKGVCSICRELPYCGGACRADAYASYQDIDAPYSLCQRLYEEGIFPKHKINEEAVYREINV